jgi:signal transduction histidine kinase/CheY-like chemotaxis protein
MQADDRDRWRAFFEHLTLGVVFQDAQGRVRVANPAAERLLGVSREELLGRTSSAPEWRAIRPDGSPFPGEEHPAMQALREGVVVRGVVMGVYLAGEDRHRWLRIDAVPLRGPPGGPAQEVFTVFDDVSSQRASERLLEAVLDAIPDVIGIQDTAHRILRYNRAGYQTLGPPEAVHGRRCFELIGRVRECEACATREALRTARPACIERDSPEVDRCFEVRAYPILEESGRVVQVVEHLRDVTAERRALAERNQMHEQFLHAQKLEAIGRLAGGVAHDFNNLLTAIGGFAEMLVGDLAEDSLARQDALEIKRAAGRATELTRQLLAFSRQQVIEPRVLTLHGVIGDMQRMLRRLLGEDVQLELALAPDLGSVWVDPGQVEQVLANLATNARDAMPAGGRLRISAENTTLDEAAAGRLPGARPGEFVRLEVADDGLGMEPETRARLFEPFFTTKPKGQGTGLGLATVWGIVVQHGGWVDVRSSPGQGCTVGVYLPRTREAPEARAAELSRATPGRGELVLLVEDEEQVRGLARRLLESLGYRVQAAEDAASALGLLEAHPDLRPELLLADVVMPGLSGRQLAELLRAQRPGLRVLLMTGWAEELAGPRPDPEKRWPLLQKPFSREALARAVRSALDAPPR